MRERDGGGGGRGKVGVHGEGIEVEWWDGMEVEGREWNGKGKERRWSGEGAIVRPTSVQ